MGALNVFPVSVVHQGVTHKKARVRTDRDQTRMQVWVLDTHFPHEPICVIDKPVIAVNEAYNMWAPRRMRQGSYALADGTVLDVKGEPGCGCGNKLLTLPPMSMTSEQGAA